MDLATKMGLSSSTYALYPTWLVVPSLFQPSVLSTFGFTLEGWMWFAFVLAVLLAFGVFLVFVSIVSQGALISSVAQAAKRRTLPNTSKAWHAGVAHFWRLFFINVVKKVSLVMLAVITGWATLNVAVENTATAGDTIIFFLVFILSVVVGMVVSFLALYAAGYVVVEEYSLGEAIAAAWELFRSHWLVSIEVGLVVLLFNAVIAIVSVAALFVCLLPTIVLWFVAVKISSMTLVAVAFLLGMVLFVPFVLFLGSTFTVFTTSAWTYLFMKMHKHGMVSRIVRLLS